VFFVTVKSCLRGDEGGGETGGEGRGGVVVVWGNEGKML
jgi:hypothetical protein